MNVIKYKVGTKIAEPGIYSGVPMEAYHGDLCAGPSISSSGLRTIEAKTPLHYYATSYLNPNREPEEVKDHFSFGRAAHTLLLGESGFREQFVIRPDKWTDWRKGDAQAWRKEQQETGKTVLVPDQIATIKAIAASLETHPLVKAGVLQGLIEHTIVAKDEPTGVYLKSRPDVLPTADGTVVDVKTTTDASPDAVRRAILNYNYPMQGALVGKTLKAVTGTAMTAFVLVFIEKAAPYAVSVVEVDLDWIAYANRQLRRAIDIFAKCVSEDNFPGYEGESVVHMPEWLRKRMDDETDVGILPREEAA